MATLFSTPTEYRTDRLSQELRDVRQRLRDVDGKIAEAGKWAVFFAIAKNLLGYIASIISLMPDGS